MWPESASTDTYWFGLLRKQNSQLIGLLIWTSLGHLQPRRSSPHPYVTRIGINRYILVRSFVKTKISNNSVVFPNERLQDTISVVWIKSSNYKAWKATVNLNHMMPWKNRQTGSRSSRSIQTRHSSLRRNQHLRSTSRRNHINHNILGKLLRN
jgi:hypothetical protein